MTRYDITEESHHTLLKDFWEPRFDELAKFNGEKARGVVHHHEHRRRMAVIQEEYDAKTRDREYFAALAKMQPTP